MDENALVCDLAETYGIYEYEELPARKIAVFACGLSKEARIIRKMSDTTVSYDEVMQAVIVDRLNWLCWSKTKDGKNGWNRPESLAKRMLDPPKKEKLQGSPDTVSFMEWRKKFVED